MINCSSAFLVAASHPALPAAGLAPGLYIPGAALEDLAHMLSKEQRSAAAVNKRG